MPLALSDGHGDTLPNVEGGSIQVEPDIGKLNGI